MILTHIFYNHSAANPRQSGQGLHGFAHSGESWSVGMLGFAHRRQDRFAGTANYFNAGNAGNDTVARLSSRPAGIHPKETLEGTPKIR